MIGLFEQLQYYAPPEAPKPNAKGEVPPAVDTLLTRTPEEPTTDMNVQPGPGEGGTLLGTL